MVVTPCEVTAAVVNQLVVTGVNQLVVTGVNQLVVMEVNQRVDTANLLVLL